MNLPDHEPTARVLPRRALWLVALPFLSLLMGASAWTPASSGAPALALWFDGADGSSLTVTASNQVLGWHDKSGNGRDATADVSYAPSLTTLNGKSALDFGPFGYGNGGNPHMFFPVVQAGTVFKVWGSAQGGAAFFMTNRYNYSWHRSVRQSENNPANPIFETDNNFSEPAVRSGDADTRVNGLVIDPSAVGLSGDWDIVANRVASGNTFPTDTLSLDRTYRSGGEGIAEVIVVSGRLSEYDLQRIEGYLAWKWGLQGKLPSNHPYKNQAPMVAGLANGGFEAGALGANGFTYRPTDQGPWIFNGDAGDMTLESPISNATPATPDGYIAAFVQIQGSVEQTFTIDAASVGSYAVSFLIAQRQYLNRQSLSVQIDGTEVMALTAPSDANWHPVLTPSFNLAAGSHTLRFQGLATNDATAFVDAVALTAAAPPGPAMPVAELRLEEDSWSGVAGEVADSSGQGHPGVALGSPLPSSRFRSGARPGDPGTCKYASMAGGAFDVPNLPVSTAAGASTTVMFWMYWDGTDRVMPMGWNDHDLWLAGGQFGFNTASSDIYGIDSTGLANGWHHVAAIYVNGDVTSDRLYIDGSAQALSQRFGSPNASYAVVATTLRIGGWTRDGGFRFSGSLDEFKVFNGTVTDADVVAAMSAGHACGASYPPAAFNAYESATAAGATTGSIHTKVAGTSFVVDVVALNESPSAIRTNFSGGVLVEVLDASDNSGALDANGCRASWAPVPSGAATSVVFGTGDAGRKSVTLSEAEAWRDLRLRITTPATGTPVTQGCSSDDFALRPAAFAALSVTDADAGSAGTSRSLTNTAVGGGVVHKAGQPFTVQARAVNGAGSTTVNYAGSPAVGAAVCTGAACVANWTTVAGENGSFSVSGTKTVRYGADTRWSTLIVSGAVGCNNATFGDPAQGTVKICQVGAVLGSLTFAPTAVAGVINRNGSYSEVGAISLQLVDSSFSNVDASDGSSPTERNIVSTTLDIGRFVPDHFDVVSLAAPVLKTFDSTCGARSFTYIGQPFGYAGVAQARVLARNAAGVTTAGYAGPLWKLSGGSLTQAFPVVAPTPSVNSSRTTAPTLTSNGDGTGLLVGIGTDKLSFDRNVSTPSAPFNASISLAWSEQDATEAGVAGNGVITTATPLLFSGIAFDAGNQMRFGQLRLVPAYGSELVDLPVLIEAQYWDGQRMTTNSADQCTALPTGAVAMGNYQRNLAACKTAVGNTTLTLANGRTFVKLAKPGSGNSGSVDLGLQLGASAAGQTCKEVNGALNPTTAAGLPWLQGRWSGAAAFDQNPATRASFGQYRSPLIYQREMF